MGISDDAIAEGKRCNWANINSQVTQLLHSKCKKMSLRERKCPKVAFLLIILLPLALLMAFELCFEQDNQLSSLLSSSPLILGKFSGTRPLIRFPNEGLPRRVQPGGILSSAFLREGNINTSTFNLSYGEVRPFQPYGVGTHLFLHLGTYRSSARDFSTVGSIGRGVEDWLHPQFGCKWVDNNGTAVEAKEVQKHRPAVNFQGLYDALVIICTFDEDVAVDGHGGTLWISYWREDKYRTPESFVALTEAPGEYKASAFEPPFEFDIVYCGSPIFGNVSAERVREWLAYHAYILGDRSHFIFYDAGGFHEDVQKVVRPWVELGRVSVQNIRQIDMYNGFYYHQRTMVNDCLFKSQFLANWTFFFDIDEYLFVDPLHNISTFLAEKAAQDVSVIKYDQKPMSTTLCSLQEASVDNATRDAINSKLWGFEKFIFNMHWKGDPEANKYAVQGRHILVTEVHNATPKRGKNVNLRYGDHIWFHHFHGFIAEHGEGCRDFTDAGRATWNEPFLYGTNNYSADFTLANLAEEVRRFERATIGEQPFLL